MPEITLPSQDLLINHQWTPPVPNVLRNESEFSAKTFTWEAPGRNRWEVGCSLVPRAYTVDKHAWRLFWEQAANPLNYFRVRRECKQLPPALPQDERAYLSGGNGINQCRIAGYPGVVQTILLAGQFITFNLLGGGRSMMTLSQNLVTDNAGIALATFTRRFDPGFNPNTGASICNLNDPYAFFQLTNPQSGISESDGQLNMQIEAAEYVV
jgi:hypothetical protein